MKEVTTTPGKYQVVRSENGCTVTQTMDNGQRIEDNVPAGESTAVFAFTSRIEVDDDSAVVREVFNAAPQQRLALLGVLGGNGGLPAGFKRVEYLQSDGGQYIEVPALVAFPFFVTCDAQFLSTTNDSNVYLWGFLNGNALNFIGRAGVFISSNVGGINHPAWGFAAACFADYRFKRYSGEERAVYSVERESLLTSPAGLINGNPPSLGNLLVTEDRRYTPTTPYLFARKVEGLPANYSVARIWNFKIEINGELVCNLVPCVNTDTGEPCMFDLVSKKPLYNSGSGDFTYPTERTTYALRRVLPDWGKLTENGLRRLYHAPANYTGELYDYAMENGYKPIVEPEKPEEGYWTPRWKETEDEIVLEWIETEPPTDDFGLPMPEELTNN